MRFKVPLLSTRGRIAGLAATLAVGVPALAVAAVVPDSADVPDGAQAIELLPAHASEVLELPGDQDWYTILGRNPDDSVNAVFVRVLQTPPACTAPLRVALFNPEQRWMRTTEATAGNVATVIVPGLTSRYLIRVDSTEPGCSGLEYEVTYVATDRPKPDNSASKCIIARAARIDAKDRLEMLETARPKYAPDSRPRYDRYVARARRTLAAARKAVKRACA
jgi:Fe-S cluster assembly iron-binding protein IscA